MNIDKKNFAKTLGHNIAKYRQELGLTQEQLAEKIDLGNEAISRIERGITVPSLIRLFELSNVFHCSVADLLTQTAEKDEIEYLSILFQGLSTSDRHFVINHIKNLIDYIKQKS